MTQKPKMLFLDDRTKRIHSAIRKYGKEYDLTIVTNVREFLRYVDREKYDIISMDHDLCGLDYMSINDPQSGMEAIRYILDTHSSTIIGGYIKHDCLVIIHSSNNMASDAMVSALQSAGLNVRRQRFEYDGPENSNFLSNGVSE